MLGVFDLASSCFFDRLCRTSDNNSKFLEPRSANTARQAGMSQEKLAEKAELHPVYVGKVERGEQWISLHALLRVAKALGVPARSPPGPLISSLLLARLREARRVFNARE